MRLQILILIMKLDLTVTMNVVTPSGLIWFIHLGHEDIFYCSVQKIQNKKIVYYDIKINIKHITVTWNILNVLTSYKMYLENINIIRTYSTLYFFSNNSM